MVSVWVEMSVMIISTIETAAAKPLESSLPTFPRPRTSHAQVETVPVSGARLPGLNRTADPERERASHHFSKPRFPSSAVSYPPHPAALRTKEEVFTRQTMGDLPRLVFGVFCDFY